ncbi:MAG: hypothetical protein ACI9XJ_002762 [Marivirga sp.]|jgi:hypothetical protein
MRIITKRIIVIGLVLVSIKAFPQKDNCAIEGINQKLMKVYKKDKGIREQLMPLLESYQEDGKGKLKFLILALKMNRLDQRNQKVVLKLIGDCGWPEPLSKAAHNTIFLVLQHSSDSLRQQYFPMVQKLANKSFLKLEDEALLFDRMQMNAGLAQKYGTQTFTNAEGNNQIWPVENLDSLENYREKMGLPSTDVYV